MKTYSLIHREEISETLENNKIATVLRTRLLLKDKPYKELEAYVLENKIPFCQTQVIRGE
jgi:hypothetical protein